MSAVRRRVVSIGAGGAGPRALTFVNERLGELERALRPYGYEWRAPDPATLLGPAMRLAVIEAAAGLDRDDLLIVHVIGHGELSASGRLLVLDARGGTGDGANDPNEWVRTFADTPGLPATLFLIDCCYAGTAARQPWQVQEPAAAGRAWIVAACGGQELAYRGRFTQAAANVLNALVDSAATFGHEPEFLKLGPVGRLIKQEVVRLAAQDEDHFGQEIVAGLTDMIADDEAAFFPNPHHRPTTGAVVDRRRIVAGLDAGTVPIFDEVDEGLDPRHFTRSASGLGDRVRDGAGCFRGREDELFTLSVWFAGADPAPVRVVTGSPGAGKSALLGFSCVPRTRCCGCRRRTSGATPGTRPTRSRGWPPCTPGSGR